MKTFSTAAAYVAAAAILAVSASCEKNNDSNSETRIPDKEYISPRIWDVYYAQFFPEETLFYVMNGSTFIWNENKDGYKYITAQEFADQYAMDWNYENPNNLIQPSELMGFEFQEVDGFTNYMEFNFREDGTLIGWDGSTTPNGYTVSVLNTKGQYTLDEETGIITVIDEANEYGTRTVLIQLSIQHYGELSFEFLEKKYFGLDYVEGSLFPFMLSNYDKSQRYIPAGRIRYDSRETDESRHPEKVDEGDAAESMTEMQKTSVLAPSAL